MRIRQNYRLLLPTIFLMSLWARRTLAAGSRRKQSSDSILEIMNIREIEQMLSERRTNSSHDEGGQFIIQNDLEEDFTEPTDRYRHRQRPPHIAIDFAYNGGIGGGAGRRNMDVVMPYNDSLVAEPTYSSDLLADLQAIRSDKILKSSKNALYITRREYLKKDWCKTEPLIQRIREHGCLTRTIINRFCYGQCNSFYIPKSPKRRRANGNQLSTKQPDHFDDEDLTGAAFRSCGFCKPKKFTWITVTLKCPSLMPQLRKKRVQRIKQCKCMAEPLD